MKKTLKSASKPTKQREEVEKVINTMKNNKSPGDKGVTKEQIKHSDEQFKEEISNLLCQIWKTEKIPEAWRKVIILPIYKKGDKTLYENYRRIALLDVTYKIFASILKIYAEKLYQEGLEKAEEHSIKFL
ncbi:uncharacterized protein LOC130444433 [Diorhabda sublineata]|uniref:uncharacterized protein LOC130444433 n=1 Tax=Diorhabda sublineata TaxID=1163346 RepID=UPI0024E0E8D5|nr:uncharacterized protein LOC130444433 [Diorhabda sublineata]